MSYVTEAYGTNTKIRFRGCCELRAGGNLVAGTTIASLPIGVRPTNIVVVSVQGQSGSEQGSVDFQTNGNVVFQGGGGTFTEINFSQVSYFIS